MKKYTLMAVCLLISFSSAKAQTISTIAGTGTAGYSGEGIAATASQIYPDGSITTDGAGNIYFVEQNNRRVRKVSTTGIISTVAGNGVFGNTGDGGPATDASIQDPTGVAVDGSGNIYICDASSACVRKVDASGIITTILSSGLTLPMGVAVDSSGNVYIPDVLAQKIFKITSSGTVSTFAGTGVGGFSGDGSPATDAMIQGTSGITIDAAGNLYFRQYNWRIRKINTAGIISTVVGTGTDGFDGDGGPTNLATIMTTGTIAVNSSGVVYLAQDSTKIRMIDASGIITTIAGGSTTGFSGDGGLATAAQLYNPAGTAVDNAGNLYFVDGGNNRIRKVAHSSTTAIATQPGIGRMIVSPNPSHDGVISVFIPSLKKEQAHVILRNIVAETVTEFTMPTNSPISISLPAPLGIYLLSAETSDAKWSECVIRQ